MSDNPRPATYGAAYEAALPARIAAPRPFVATVAGKHCEQGDLLVRDAHLPADVAVGDVLVTPAHRRVRPLDGVELQPRAASGRRLRARRQARVVVRRETFADLVATSRARNEHRAGREPSGR